MLKYVDRFNNIERNLIDMGKIQKFEQEYGPILGRMMITLGDIPENLKPEILNHHNEQDLYVFECSFDFYDSLLGIAVEKNTFRPVCKLWITEQVEHTETPNPDWIEFFIQILCENVFDTEGSFGMPIYVFVNDTSEMVIVPSRI